MEIANHLPREGIVAAGNMREGMPGWKTSDKALELLSERFPDFDEASILLKTVAINALYSTNVYATTRMAEHIKKVLGGVEGTLEGPQLVEEIARLPITDTQKRNRRHYSFASKFAHFFIDPEEFPIKDGYAIEMLKYHLGKENFKLDDSKQYVAYVENYAQLKKDLGYGVSNKELDIYLWIAGEMKTWMKNDNASINTELRGVLNDYSNNGKDVEVIRKIISN